MVESVANRGLDDAPRLGGRELVLGLPLEIRFADEDRQHGGAAGHHVVGTNRVGAAGLADALGVIAERAEERRAEASLVRAPVRGRDRVAIGANEPVLAGAEPRDRPFKRAVPRLSLRLSREDLIGHLLAPVDLAPEIILETTGEAEHGLDGYVVQALAPTGSA